MLMLLLLLLQEGGGGRIDWLAGWLAMTWLLQKTK
jgi:hypothetical protein